MQGDQLPSLCAKISALSDKSETKRNVNQAVVSQGWLVSLGAVKSASSKIQSHSSSSFVVHCGVIAGGEDKRTRGKG